MADGVLGEIVAAKRAEIGRRLEGVAIDALRARATPSTRSLAAAIARPGARFILEIKKASPSQGLMRADADTAAIARGYAGVADALSVLTDQAFFGGSLDDLAAARAAFDGPLLAKDFFVDPRQVAEARIAGADAVLVMLSVLDDEEARAMIAEARRFGMDALVEVHDEAEMQRALALNAPLIGINNRDLRDLSIDLATTERLAALAGDRMLVSESGIGSRADIERLAPAVDGFLIGSSLMRAVEPAQAARALIFGRVKLCGLNRKDDITAGAAASFAGLIFVERSPRCLGVEEAAPLAAHARQSGIHPVGIFRNAPPELIARAARSLGLSAVQLHGGEDEDYVAGLRASLGGIEIWKALSVGRDRLRSSADRLLFDNGDGGSGQAFDWAQIADHPQLNGAILAGGIGAQNAAEARSLGAFAIDVGSSVDTRPGLKSRDRIDAVFAALRPAARAMVFECA